jgi:hypothetical protein
MGGKSLALSPSMPGEGRRSIVNFISFDTMFIAPVVRCSGEWSKDQNKLATATFSEAVRT